MPLFDIFKKRKGKNTETSEKINPKILIDIHEKNSLVQSELQSLGAQVDFQDLKVGDYLINNIVIERKTLSDFVSSMISRRLFAQLNNMQQYEKKLLIIEMDKKVDFNPNAIKGMILSISLEMNIPVIQTRNEEDTAKYLFLLAKKQLKPRAESSLHSRIPKTKSEQKKYILESFPNIGPATAKKLLKKFKTIKAVLNAGQGELREVIGKKAEAFGIVDE